MDRLDFGDDCFPALHVATLRSESSSNRRWDAFVDATTLTERVNAWVALVRWSREAWDASDERLPDSKAVQEANARLDAFLALVDDNAERHRLGQATGTLFTESDGTIAFGYAGIPSERGFLAELGERVMNHLLPRARDDRDLSNVLRRLFRSERDVNRLASMSDARFARLGALLFPPRRSRRRDRSAPLFRKRLSASRDLD